MKNVVATCFDSFTFGNIPKEIKNFTRNKTNIKNIYGKQGYNSVMCQYFSVGLIDFMLKGKSLLDCNNLFSPNKYENTDSNTELVSMTWN